MILKKKVFLKSMILKEEFSLKNKILKEKVFVRSIIWNYKFFDLLDFEWEFFRLVRFRINLFTTRQILSSNNLPKPTTCTFNIVLLHITMCNYRPQNLHQLDTSIHHLSNKNSCTLFHKEYYFWHDWCVLLSSLNLLDIRKTSCCYE